MDSDNPCWWYFLLPDHSNGKTPLIQRSQIFDENCLKTWKHLKNGISHCRSKKWATEEAFEDTKAKCWRFLIADDDPLEAPLRWAPAGPNKLRIGHSARSKDSQLAESMRMGRALLSATPFMSQIFEATATASLSWQKGQNKSPSHWSNCLYLQLLSYKFPHL